MKMKQHSYKSYLHFKGLIHSIAYAPLSSSISNAIQIIKRDIINSFIFRFDLINDDLNKNGQKIINPFSNPLDLEVDPFSFNEANLSRIDAFQMIIPRRLFFTTRKANSFKFCDYQLFYEEQNDVEERIFTLLNIVVDQFMIKEKVNKEGNCNYIKYF